MTNMIKLTTNELEQLIEQGSLYGLTYHLMKTVRVRDNEFIGTVRYNGNRYTFSYRWDNNLDCVRDFDRIEHGIVTLKIVE